MVALLFSTSGCVTSPGDGGRVPSWTSPIPVNGFVPNGGDQITITAFNFTTNSFEAVATLTSSTSSSFTAWGFAWYGWSASVTLASRFWRNANSGTGAYARLQVQDGPNGLFTPGRGIDAVSCGAKHIGEATLAGTFADCASQRRPDMYVYTSDYENGSANCPIPTTVKDHYNVTEIPACKQADIADLIAQNVTHDLVLKHHNTSFIDHNSATGPNSFFRGHHEYVREMQNFLSVYGEQWLPNGRLPFWTPTTTISTALARIPTNPANCLSDTPGCTGWLQSPHVNLSPNIALPTSLTAANMCSQNSTVNTLLNNLNPWHGTVHNTVGGVSGTFASFDSPAAVLFWPWHKYVDDLYVQWEACGFPEP